MIRIDNLRKFYGTGESRNEVLRGISLNIKDGDFMVILGASGSGKSTFLNVISGLEPADAGNIFYNDRNISTMSDSEITNFRKNTLGYVFQQYFLLPNLNVDKNVKMGADLANNTDYRKLIEAVGLKDKAKKYPHELSGGEQQRVSIARALAKKPEVLFLDEPTGGLDDKSKKELIKILKELKKDMTLIVVTHDADYINSMDGISIVL